ncbi:glycosyltransferase [Methanomicrobium mobile]|uniref:glycosyltransferase n=1 Tax=Methanomicrobium mobile TaxID=2205 RepID=UPI0006935738|nr:glycosyltransferase [Methanomicrobium mobile]
MNKCPLVSVVIPVYNGSNYVREAIDSALAQTYKNIEILVIDDGSTDNTWDILQSYGDKIRKYHKQNGGVSTALNMGIKNMRGEWFAWLSHDDLWLPENIEKKIEFLNAHPNYRMCYGEIDHINSEHKILKIYNTTGRWYPKGKMLRQMLRSGYIVDGLTTIINKECFEKIGVFNENLRYCQDYEFWYRLAQVYDLGFCKGKYSQSRVHPEQTGYIHNISCHDEFRKTRLYLYRKTRTEEFYPELLNPNMSKIKLIVLQFSSGIYLKYLKLCIQHNIPELSEMPKEIARAILPKKIKAYIRNNW